MVPNSKILEIAERVFAHMSRILAFPDRFRVKDRQQVEDIFEISQFYLREFRHDDDGFLTIEKMVGWGFVDNSTMQNMKRFEILDGIRVIFHAQVGGWSRGDLWIGSRETSRGGVVHLTDLKNGQIRKLCGVLGISLDGE